MLRTATSGPKRRETEKVKRKTVLKAMRKLLLLTSPQQKRRLPMLEVNRLQATQRKASRYVKTLFEFSAPVPNMLTC